VIYPEGTRARRGDLKPFRRAGVQALLESAPEIAVVGVTIDGSWHLLQSNLFPVPFGTKIRVHIGDPIPRHEDEDPTALVNELREQIEKKLAAWRSE